MAYLVVKQVFSLRLRHLQWGQGNFSHGVVTIWKWDCYLSTFNPFLSKDCSQDIQCALIISNSQDNYNKTIIPQWVGNKNNIAQAKCQTNVTKTKRVKYVSMTRNMGTHLHKRLKPQITSGWPLRNGTREPKEEEKKRYFHVLLNTVLYWKSFIFNKYIV